MSSGHHGHQGFGISASTMKKLYDDQHVMQNYYRDYVVNKEYDIPYLGGYSVDGHTVYLDRHLPDEITFEQDGRKYNFRPSETIPYHERFEKAIMDAIGWSYSHAHRAANANERRYVVQLGLPWSEYQKSLEPYIKADEIEKLVKVPPDLDMRPYYDPPVDHKLVDRLEQAMDGGDVRKSKKEVKYSLGHKDSHCGPVAKWKGGDCTHFITPHGCEKVQGYINPTYWCELFKAK
jgi:hypothetical protein